MTRLRRTSPTVGTISLALTGVALAIATGCSRDEPSPPYGLLLRIEADPGQGLPGAAVAFRGSAIGRTDDAGTVLLAIRGGEGDHVPLSISCPIGYVSPSKPVDVVLHRLDDPGRRPEYDVRCPPANRSMVVVVRADHGPNLPVTFLGKEVARTDESGAAHALLEVTESDEIEITLSTAEPGSERLRPQNPSMKFTSAGRDDIRLFDVHFELAPEKRPPPQRRALPIRLN